MSRIAVFLRNNWNMRGFILLCFFFAGMASLMDQVLWMRQLGLIFGTTLEAVSTVLAVFMAGLALGSYIFGKMADKSKHPLRLYAVLQMGIGAYVMLTPLIFIGLTSLQVSIYGSLPIDSIGITVIRVFLSFLVLIIPTTLMGGTLPVIAKYFVRREEELGGGIGNLYFINTLGAALGAFLAGFFLIPYIGVLASTILAASIDFSIGVGFYLLYKHKLGTMDKPLAEEATVEPSEGVETLAQQLSKKQLKRAQHQRRKLERSRPTKYSRMMKWVVFAGFAVGGLASLSLEVSWTRVISMVLGSSVYAFSLMLVAFLLGIALGSAIAAKFVDRSRHLWIYFLAVEALIGIAVLVLNPLLGELPLLFVRVFPNVQANFWLLQFVQFMLLLLIMLVPTLLMGAAFPIATKIYTDDLQHMGGSVGRLYAGNTFGSMVGPLLTGFIIIPLIGMQWSISIVSIIYIAIAAAVFIVGLADSVKASQIAMKGATKFVAGVTGIVVIAVLVVNILIPVLGSWDRRILNSGVFLYAGSYYTNTENLSDALRGYYQPIFYDEGLTATVTVYNEQNGDRALTINGKVDATSFGDLPTELISGHLPMLLHANPEEVLLVGLGSGITLGAVEIHPSLANVDAVEIEGAVIEAAKHFADANNSALDSEKLNMIRADARNYVLAQTKTGKKYDVITAEPSNPWMAGNSILFAREQFELYKRILSDDGIICQWVHYYSMSNADLQTVFNTFTDVFPSTTLWRTTSDLLLVGTKNDFNIDFAALKIRLQQADILTDLKRIDIDDIYGFLGKFVMGPEALADYCEGAPIHTDNRPVLQFSAPKSLYTDTNLIIIAQRLQQYSQSMENVDSLLINYGEEANFVEQMSKQREFYIHYTNAVVNSQNALFSQKEGDTAAQEAYADAALAANEAILSTGANNAYAHRRLGSIRMVRDEFEEAVTHLEQSVALNPTHVPTLIDLADVYLSLSRFEDARNAISSATDLVDNNGFLYAMRGYANFGAGNLGAAIADYTAAIEIYPDNVIAYYYRGQFYHSQGENKKAIADYIKVTELRPNTPIAERAQLAVEQLANQ